MTQNNLINEIVFIVYFKDYNYYNRNYNYFQLLVNLILKRHKNSFHLSLIMDVKRVTELMRRI
jgi:hypothetical protein